jgi:hypothetical protein
MPRRKAETTDNDALTIKESNTDQVVAMIEKRKFDPVTGQRHSKEFPCTYNLVDWIQFQEFGAKLGWFVNSIVSAPDGVDTSYKNPGSK